MTLVTKTARTNEPEMEAASSTTSTEGPSRLPVDPAEWSVEDVIQHINCVDIQLNTFADLFRKHVSFIVNYVVLKICYKKHLNYLGD